MSGVSKQVDSAFSMNDDDDEWESMPVEPAGSKSSAPSFDAYSNLHDLPYGDEGSDESDPDDPRRFRSLPSRTTARSPKARSTKSDKVKKIFSRSKNVSEYAASSSANQSRSHHGPANATGKHLDIDDARGYNWRSKPTNGTNEDDEDSDQEKGYTQLRLDEDEEAEELHAATEYLFQDGAKHDPYGEFNTATPLNQMKTTKQLLSEGQKIAYVGLCSLIATEMVRNLRRVPGKTLDPAKESIESWKVKVMARLYQHMDIESREQNMIESLAEHGVLPTDLAPSLITTQTIDNPDFDPEALREREEEEEQHRIEDKLRLQEKSQSDVVASHPSSEQGTKEKVSEVTEADNLPAEEEASSAPRDVSQDTKDLHPSLDPFDDSEMDIGDSLNGNGVTSSTAASKSTKASLPKRSPDVAEDQEGDIGVMAESDDEDRERPQDASTGKELEKQVQQSPPRPTSHGAESAAAIADPNTASRLPDVIDAVEGRDAVADAEVGPGSVTTTLGLTKQPQAVEPPPGALDGVTTSISSADATITLDLRWTVLCDLFLVLTADSVYDARSRVLLERIASYLGLTWMDVTKFEKRVTDALEIEEGIESLHDQSAVQKRMQMARKKRMLMMGLATVGGGLVIGLSAGLLAPVIGAGMGAALGAVGISGTSGFLGGVGGAALITSTGTVGGMSLGGRGMSRRTRSVKTFEFKPIHNNKRVNAIITVPGFMSGPLDDVRLPFSVIDSIMGDAFSVFWEPDMMQEMGNALGILWNETIVQGVQQVLAATVAGAMFTALAWPLWLTKLGYLIDNPWSNALDRSQAAGLILADTLVKRQLGVRPITLVGYSLGARVIFYALLELSRIKAYGIVQNVYIMGAPITAKDDVWKEARSVVSGRFVSAFSRSDWILGYLHRAASGGLRSIAGLHPVERVQDVENVDVTHVVPGHLAYRALMPLVLSELGFRTTADYFDEPEDLNAIPERQIVREDEKDNEYELKSVKTKTGGFGKIWRRKGTSATNSGAVTPTRSPSMGGPATPARSGNGAAEYNEYEDDDLPPREAHEPTSPVAKDGASESKEDIKAGSDAPGPRASLAHEVAQRESEAQRAATPEIDRPPSVSAHIDTDAILRELRESGIEVRELESSLPPLVASTKQVEERRPKSPPAGTSDTAAAPAAPATAAAVSGSTRAADVSTSHEAMPRRGSDFGNERESLQETDTAISQSNVVRPPMPGEGISLTFASYDDDDEIGAAALQEDKADGSFQRYGLGTDAAKELEAKFRGGYKETSTMGLGDVDAGQSEAWTPNEESWGITRPGMSYDSSGRSNVGIRTLPRQSSYGFGGMLSASNENSLEAPTPPSNAIGRGFDYADSSVSSIAGSNAFERPLADSSTILPPPFTRREDGATPTGPDPWAENPW